MNKIIVAIDGLRYSDSAVKYAIDIARQSNATLTGIFLDDFTYHSYKIYDLIGADGVSEEKRERLESLDKETRQHAVRNFEEACQEGRVNCSIHHDRSIAIQELLHESIYADLLVIGNEETLTHYPENAPTRFIRDLLSEVQCPVLVAPADYKPIDKVVLLYDGEPSSVFAIRMFSYVCPFLKKQDTEVISVNNMKQSLHVPDNRLMKEFMKRHYPNARYTVRKGIPEHEIISHLIGIGENTLVVLGAYRRGMVSRWFRTSMADLLMQEFNSPLFIAHNK